MATKRDSRRPKGHVEWSPAPHIATVLEQVREVQEVYRSEGALTLRQIFYRLVAEHGFEKSFRSYKNLGDWLVRARRAQLIGWNSIRDDELKSGGGGGYPSLSYWCDATLDDAEYFELNHMLDQPVAIEVWCEATGMVPMLARMLSDWHIPVYSPKGFSSVTVTHDAALRVVRRDRPTVMLHVGDYDPSGESIFEAIAQDTGKFVAEYVGATYNPETGETIEITGSEHPNSYYRPKRIALLREQVDQYDFPTAPKNEKDSRSRKWDGETTQLEAIPPPLLRELVQGAVLDHIDQDILDERLALEAHNREQISKVLDDIRALKEEEA